LKLEQKSKVMISEAEKVLYTEPLQNKNKSCCTHSQWPTISHLNIEKLKLFVSHIYIPSDTIFF